MLRALGWHWRVAVLQFLKGERATGERQFFAEYFPEIRLEGVGLGRTIREGDHAGFAQAGWRSASELLNHFDGELLVLDELNVALSHGYLDVAEVADALKHRRRGLHVVITGRHSPEEIRAVSDLVSVTESEKHPYRSGIPAQKGLDY